MKFFVWYFPEISSYGGHLICRVILYFGIPIKTLFGQNAKFMNVKAGGPHLR
jgi:hypothetical protein